VFGVDDTTSIVSWHCPGTPALIAGIVPPVSAIGRVPGVAVTVKPQVFVATVNGLATTTPTGSVSVNATAVADDAFAFSKTIVRVEACPATTEFGTKLLLTPTEANAEALKAATRHAN